MTVAKLPLHVSLVALPDAAISTMTGIYDVLNSFRLLGDADPTLPAVPPFDVEIVAETAGPVALASGLPIDVHSRVSDVATTDIVIVPSILTRDDDWIAGRYPLLVNWLRRMHEGGAVLCSACSGIFLLAETGLFDGRDATVHWIYAPLFHRVFPAVRAAPERVLVVSGERGEFVTSGASTSWHDLVLYLITRHVGATAAQTIARLFALQWHRDGLTPYIVFSGPVDHGDAVILDAQQWLAGHCSVGSPVEEMVRRSGLAERTFKRRFTNATGHAPIAYVQRLRVEDAKRRLERTAEPVDEIGWQVGYEDPAFFRRLFKRLTGLTPGDYRRRFQIPAYARGGEGHAP